MWSLHALQKKSSCFNHWMVTLVAGDNGYEKFILVLEVNCISNPSSNHSLQLTIFRTTVSHYKKNDDIMVILSQRLLYLQHKFIVCSLMYMQVWPLSKMHNQWLLYLQHQVVEGLGSFLSGCLMQLAKYTIHNHCLFSLSATRVTTLWLKQPICFCCVLPVYALSVPTQIEQWPSQHASTLTARCLVFLTPSM